MKRDSKQITLGVIGIAIVLIVAVVILTFRFGYVKPGYVGLKIEKVGPNKGLSAEVRNVGINPYNIILSEFVIYPITLQSAIWTADSREGSYGNQEITFTTQDGLSISADIALNYLIKSEFAPVIYAKFRLPVFEIQENYLRRVSRGVIAELGNSYTADTLYQNIANFTSKITIELNKKLTEEGFELDSFQFVNSIRYPSIFTQALNEKIQATQEAEKRRRQLEQAIAQKEIIIKDAEANAERIRINAEAQATANRLIAQSLNENIIEYKKVEISERQIEKWNGAYPNVVAGDAGGILLDARP